MRRHRGTGHGLGFTQHSGHVSSHPLNTLRYISRGGISL